MCAVFFGAVWSHPVSRSTLMTGNPPMTLEEARCRACPHPSAGIAGAPSLLGHTPPGDRWIGKARRRCPPRPYLPQSPWSRPSSRRTRARTGAIAFPTGVLGSALVCASCRQHLRAVGAWCQWCSVIRPCKASCNSPILMQSVPKASAEQAFGVRLAVTMLCSRVRPLGP
jgi:hypothetical protein